MFETVEKIYTKEVNRHAKLFRYDLLIISTESKKAILSIPKNGTAFGLKFAQLGNQVLGESKVCVLVTEDSGGISVGRGLTARLIRAIPVIEGGAPQCVWKQH